MDKSIRWDSVCGKDELLWDFQSSWNTSYPTFSYCFENTVMTWIPCSVVWLTLPCNLKYLYHRRIIYSWRDLTILTVMKLIISSLLVIVDFAFLLTQLLFFDLRLPYVIMGPSVRMLTFLVTTCLFYAEFARGCPNSGIQFTFWLITAGCGILPFRSHILAIITDKGGHKIVFQSVAFFTYYGLVLTETILVLLTGKLQQRKRIGDRQPLLNSKQFSAQNETNGTPEAKATFLSRITHFWISGMIVKGYRQILKFEDIYDLLGENKVRAIVPAFLHHWWIECNKSTRRWSVCNQPSLTFSLAKTVKGPLMATSALRVLVTITIFLNPIFLQEVIYLVQNKDPYNWHGYLVAAAFLLNNMLSALMANMQMKLDFVGGLRVRTAVISTIYRKSLRLSNCARRRIRVGKLVNMMAVDSQKLQDAAVFVNDMWIAPVRILIGAFYLWTVVGPSCLSGVALLACLTIFNSAYLLIKMTEYQSEQMTIKDSRLKIINQILEGIQVLKMYAWEMPFVKMVSRIRARELGCLRRIARLHAVFAVTWIGAPYMISLVVFATYILSSSSHHLDPEIAFVSLVLINILQNSTNLIPVQTSMLMQAKVSINRIEKVLLESEIDAVQVDFNQRAAVQIDNAYFSWEADESACILKSINLTVNRCKLVAIVGQVGSGKSSLISAILGELPRIDGSVYVQGSIAYVPQRSWIQNDTIRNNILFGSELNDRIYQKVIDACALGPDLDVLPAKDHTEIGERGINLSVGEKQRISLARAVYQNSDIYILDDPLSSVDAHVGNHLFRKVIGPGGMLKRKTRVLVTNCVTVLPHTDMIVVIKDGSISETGSYHRLLHKNGDFADYLRSYFTEISETSDDECNSDDQHALALIEHQLHLVSGTSDSETNTSQTVDSDVNSDTGGLWRKRRINRHKKVHRRSRYLPRQGRPAPPGRSITRLIEEEEAQSGPIKFHVIKSYVMAGGLGFFLLVLFAVMVHTGSQIGISFWLSYWSEDYFFDESDQHSRKSIRLGVYAALGVLRLGSLAGLLVTMQLSAVRAAASLHGKLLDCIMRAPMVFFDATPLGRIINRFSTDMDKVDTVIPNHSRLLFNHLSMVLSTIIVISYVTPGFLIPGIPILVVYILIQRAYIKSARQLKRIESIRRSPVYANFDETMQGLNCIRAFKQQERFIAKNDQLLDDHQKAYYAIVVSQRWLGLLLETLGALVVFFTTLFVIRGDSTITGAMAGLSVSFALQATMYINFLVRGATDLETHIISVERIKEYTKIKAEAPWIVRNNRPHLSWPQEGVVTFNKFSTKYRQGIEPVLTDISFSVASGEKVGVVGRTGAGKTSIALSLFRILEATRGTIFIDGIDISRIGLHDLRSKLTIIPQEPMMFSTTLRHNIDPSSEHSDADIWTALKHAHLHNFVNSLAKGLGYQCSEGGETLSVGQRQLICLARALLRKSKVLILDEATAGLDLETDDLIQDTIRMEFHNCTVLTIAHRLNTIMDYDKVMVLEQGRIAEYSSPLKLLEKSTSIFYGMAKDAEII